MPSLSFSRVKSLAASTFEGVGTDDVPTLAAAIAYYTVFSLPPLLVILVGIAGALFGADAVTEQIVGQASSAIGDGVGTRSVMLDASRLAPGVYVARLDGPSGTLTQRLTVVR